MAPVRLGTQKLSILSPKNIQLGKAHAANQRLHSQRNFFGMRPAKEKLYRGPLSLYRAHRDFSIAISV